MDAPREGGGGHAAPAVRTAAVLVVEDEPDVLASLCELLGTLPGVDVDGAPSMASALAMLQARAYDLVIADLRLRDGSGVDLLAWVARRDPRAALVLTSAHEDFAAMVAAVNHARIHTFLPKPWEPTEALQRLRALLEEERTVEDRLRAYARALAGASAAHPPPAPRRDAWPPS